MTYYIYQCPNCASRDSLRTVYTCTRCGFHGCWDKYGAGCWPRQQPCPKCGTSGSYKEAAYIKG